MYFHLKRPAKPVPTEGVRGVMTVEMGLVVDLCRHQPGWTLEGVRLNDLSPLWPFNRFRDEALRQAKMFVSFAEKQGHTLLTQPGDLRIWGPYVSRDWRNKAARDHKSVRAYGRTADEQYTMETVDFLILGDFLMLTPDAPIEAQRPAWAIAEEAEAAARAAEAAA